MSETKGTPLSSQIIWLENRVQELEEKNDKLNQICLEQKNDLVNIRRSQYFKENEQLKLDIAGYKNRIDILQSENKHLYDLNHDQEKEIKKLKSELVKNWKSTTASDSMDNLVIDMLDARWKRHTEEHRNFGEGIYTAKRSASVRMVEELVDEIIKSSYDDNQIKLAYAIECLKRAQS